MADIPNITPSKPLWPVRPEDKGQKRKRPPEEDKDKKRKPDSETEEPGTGNTDHDGHIDEYV